jgi:hypothetical protein
MESGPPPCCHRGRAGAAAPARNPFRNIAVPAPGRAAIRFAKMPFRVCGPVSAGVWEFQIAVGTFAGDGAICYSGETGTKY